MKFNLEEAIEILSRTASVLEPMLTGLPDKWTKSNEGENTWSPYDVIGHLIHCEKTDWFVRAKIILSDAEDKTFEPFDRFAQMNVPKTATIEALLAEFRTLRTQNLADLKALQITKNDLSKTGIHPALGEAKLEELLSSWVVHDFGHIAQISRVMAKQYRANVGSWKAYLSILK
ncbi:MAG: DinB family protein [Saprospiraceae bacterium]